MTAYVMTKIGVPLFFGVIMFVTWWALPACDPRHGNSHEPPCRECPWTKRMHWLLWAGVSLAWLLWGRTP